MLSADQIEALGQRAEQISDSLSEFLIGDIAERISEAGQLTGTASYEVWRLQNLGVSQAKLKKELKKRLNLSMAEVEDLLKQSAETGYNFDISRFPTSGAIPFAENTSLQQIVNAAVQMAQEDFSNIVQTIGFVGPSGRVQELTKAYTSACDYVFQKTVTGTQDMYSAIREATRGLAEKGIRYIDYESGVHTSMEAAVRRCVMGGMGLMQEQISQDNHDYIGCNGWEISAHHGSAPDHEPIQGKQYTDEEYTQLNNSLVRRIGTLNCGHAAFPIILGVNSPQYSEAELEQMRKENEEGVTFEGRHYSLYEATQRQRRFERAIRKQKRKILIDEKTGDKDKLQNDQIRLVRLRQEYARFSKGVGLPTQHARTETAGFDWKKGKEAENAAKAGIDTAAYREYNDKSDHEQYARYRAVLGDKVPESLAEFQQMKQGNVPEWDTLKKQYRVVNQYKVDSGEFTVDEILEMDDQLITEKRQNFKSKYKRSGNVAGAYVDQDYYLAHSKIEGPDDASGYRGDSKLVTLRKDRTFQYIDVAKSDESLRTDTFQDTEAKLFEEFAAMYERKPFKTITMISERGMCDSCKGVMEQFKARFPDVAVRVISHKKVEGDVWKYRRRKK